MGFACSRRNDMFGAVVYGGKRRSLRLRRPRVLCDVVFGATRNAFACSSYASQSVFVTKKIQGYGRPGGFYASDLGVYAFDQSCAPTCLLNGVLRLTRVSGDVSS